MLQSVRWTCLSSATVIVYEPHELLLNSVVPFVVRFLLTFLPAFVPLVNQSEHEAAYEQCHQLVHSRSPSRARKESRIQFQLAYHLIKLPISFCCCNQQTGYGRTGQIPEAAPHSVSIPRVGTGTNRST